MIIPTMISNTEQTNGDGNIMEHMRCMILINIYYMR